MKNKSVQSIGTKPAERERYAPNKFEHHIDIRKNPRIPFMVENEQNSNSFSCNWHDNLELLLVYEGTGVLHYGTQDIEMSPGMLIIINSQTMHSMTSENGVGYYIIIIDNSFFTENGIDVMKYNFNKTTRDPEIINLCMQACNEYRNRSTEKEFLSDAKLRLVFLSLVIELCSNHILGKQQSAAISAVSQKYVKEAMEYIKSNYTEKITLDGIAKIIGINKSYFAREFKKYAGQTVHTYINNLRCTKADRCLADGMSVTETAMEVGFGTLSYFTRTYRKIRGVSPSEGRGK